MPIFWFDPVRKKIGLNFDFWWSSQSIILLEIGDFRFGHLELTVTNAQRRKRTRTVSRASLVKQIVAMKSSSPSRNCVREWVLYQEHPGTNTDPAKAILMSISFLFRRRRPVSSSHPSGLLKYEARWSIAWNFVSLIFFLTCFNHIIFPQAGWYHNIYIYINRCIYIYI